jgi:hypothetical protein
MKIVDINNNKINGCFVFCVGNCEISVSTIFKKDRAEIAIFDRHNGDMVKDKLTSISAAISWVDSFGPRD